MDKKRVLLIIPVHNRSEDLNNLLTSLCRLKTDNIELSVAIVDDGSDYPLRPEIESSFRQLKFIFFRNEIPKGPGFCRNLAAGAVKSDFLWFLDSDSEIINQNILLKMIERLEKNKNLGAVGGVLEEHNGMPRIMELDILKNFIFLYRSFLASEYQASFVDGLATSNLFLGREVFDCAGGFREDLKRDEDIDLCLILRKLGYTFYQDTQTLAWHRLSDAGRQSGTFAHFTNQKLYLNDLLTTRIKLLAYYASWRLPVLLFLDMVLAPLILYRIKKDVYALTRFEKTAKYSYSASLPYFLAITYLKCYLWGLGFFLCRAFRLIK